MRVTFLISNHPILVLGITHSTKKVEIRYIGDERAVSPIISPKERNYQGLTKRLKYLMSDKPDDRSLPELLEDIRKHGIQVPWQHNLSIEVKD